MTTTTKYDLRVDLQVSRQRSKIEGYCQELNLDFNPFKHCPVPIFNENLNGLLLIDTDNLDVLESRIDKYLKPLCNLHPNWLRELAPYHTAIRPPAPYFIWHSGHAQFQPNFGAIELVGHDSLYYRELNLKIMTPLEYCHYRIFSSICDEVDIDHATATMFPNASFAYLDISCYESGKSVPVLRTLGRRLDVRACYPIQKDSGLQVRVVNF